jgi:hypothetical protein
VYLGFARERVELFLISNASAANITLSREQHIARELGVHRVCTKAFTAVTARTLGSRVGCINFVEYLGACESVTLFEYVLLRRRKVCLLLSITGLRTSVRYNQYEILVLRTSCGPEKVGVNKRGLNKKMAWP